MDDREVFATRCWNFIGGDRQIERILRELPARQPVVVRNRLAHVLPTVAALADLVRPDPWDPLPLTVTVPENALAERGLEAPVAEDAFYDELLARLYGVKAEGLEAGAGSEDLLIAVGHTDEAAAAPIASWLDRHPGLRVVFLVPAGAALAPSLRPHAAAAWSAQAWEGLNALSLPTVEEAIAEAAPARIWVAAAREATAAYTAIGAVDWLIREASVLHEPSDQEIRTLGRRVSVLREARQASGPEKPFRALVLAHMEAELGVVSTAADPRFTVTAEAIAIDIAT